VAFIDPRSKNTVEIRKENGKLIYSIKIENGSSKISNDGVPQLLRQFTNLDQLLAFFRSGNTIKVRKQGDDKYSLELLIPCQGGIAWVPILLFLATTGVTVVANNCVIRPYCIEPLKKWIDNRNISKSSKIIAYLAIEAADVVLMSFLGGFLEVGVKRGLANLASKATAQTARIFEEKITEKMVEQVINSGASTIIAEDLSKGLSCFQKLAMGAKDFLRFDENYIQAALRHGLEESQIKEALSSFYYYLGASVSRISSCLVLDLARRGLMSISDAKGPVREEGQRARRVYQQEYEELGEAEFSEQHLAMIPIQRDLRRNESHRRAQQENQNLEEVLFQEQLPSRIAEQRDLRPRESPRRSWQENQDLQRIQEQHIVVQQEQIDLRPNQPQREFLQENQDLERFSASVQHPSVQERESLFGRNEDSKRIAKKAEWNEKLKTARRIYLNHIKQGHDINDGLNNIIRIATSLREKTVKKYINLLIQKYPPGSQVNPDTESSLPSLSCSSSELDRLSESDKNMPVIGEESSDDENVQNNNDNNLDVDENSTQVEFENSLRIN